MIVTIPHSPVNHCQMGMVFAVNPVQTSARNFTAFQTLAQTLNGTNATGAAAATLSGSGATPSNTGTNGAASNAGMSAAVGLASLFALVATLL